MSEVESSRARQDSEFAVLQSIFGDQFRDLRHSKNPRKWHPLDISMTLTPQRGMSGPLEVHAQIDLHTICNDNYPNHIPFIKLENSRGLSNEQIAASTTELQTLARRLKGEVMILELAQHVEKWLLAHNKPGHGSFYEEMQSRREEESKQVQTEQEEEALKENQERQRLQDEIHHIGLDELNEVIRQDDGLRPHVRQHLDPLHAENGEQSEGPGVCCALGDDGDQDHWEPFGHR